MNAHFPQIPVYFKTDTSRVTFLLGITALAMIAAYFVGAFVGFAIWGLAIAGHTLGALLMGFALLVCFFLPWFVPQAESKRPSKAALGY